MLSLPSNRLIHACMLVGRKEGAATTAAKNSSKNSAHLFSGLRALQIDQGSHCIISVLLNEFHTQHVGAWPRSPELLQHIVLICVRRQVCHKHAGDAGA